MDGKPNIRQEDYAFSVKVAGSMYDVYHFHKDGKPGTFAFRKVGNKWEISILEAGHLKLDAVRKRLKSATDATR